MKIDFNSLKKFYDKKDVRKFRDMEEKYKNPEGIKGNRIIYSVYRKKYGDFETGLNVMESGTVNKEFFMTKGHKHEKPINEIYMLIRGKGKLLIQGGKIKVFDLKKNKVYIVPGRAGHRLINTGNKKLEVLTIYSRNAGRAYSFDFKRRFFKK